MLDVTSNDTLDGTVIKNSLLDQFQRTFPVLFDDIEHGGDHIENMKKAR